MSSRIQELQAFKWYLTEDITTDINIKKVTQNRSTEERHNAAASAHLLSIPTYT